MSNVWESELEAPPADEELFTHEQVEPVSNDLSNLMYVGYLEDTVDFAGHKIEIRTLKIGEELQAELATTRFKETNEAMRAYATAIVAAAIMSVDGRPLVVGLGPEDETIERKFRFIADNWHWKTVEEIYMTYRNLVERANLALEELKKNSN